MLPVRTRVLDAAIDLLASGGLRALTHARVDERAGVSAGSTSNYFRSRSALLLGVADGILERELPGVQAAFAPRSPEDLIDAMCVLLDATTRDRRVLTTARLVLFVEASHNAELRDVLSHGRAALEASVVDVFAGLGARDPRAAAEAVAAVFEGLILHRIARHVDTDPRPAFETVVRGALA